MPNPVFVIGKGRSGTTWLATQLSMHPDIAGVCDEEAYGIIESAYFSHVHGRYGDLKIDSNFVEFVEVMSATDYFQLAGADRRFLYSLPRNYEEIFRIVMDEFAKKNGANYWVEKTPAHTHVLKEIARYYPDAKFIGILRPLDQVAESTIAFYNKNKWLMGPTQSRMVAIIRIAVAWVYYNKLLKRFARQSNRMLVVDYRDLVSDPEPTMRNICSYIGVGYDPRLNEQTYRRHTSFKDGVHREDILGPKERALIPLVATVSKLIPLPLMHLMNRVWVKVNGRRTLPYSHFRILKSRQQDSEMAVEAQ